MLFLATVLFASRLNSASSQHHQHSHETNLRHHAPLAAVHQAQAPPIDVVGCTSWTVSPSWMAADCSTADAHFPKVGLQAANAIDPVWSAPHHPVWSAFTPWRGHVNASSADERLTDFMGLVIPRKLYCNAAYMNQPRAHALRVRQCQPYLPEAALSRGVDLQTAWPVVSEEYFEYCDVLAAAKAYAEETAADTAAGAETGGPLRRPFVFVELGAGYGHWTFTAHKALQQLDRSAPYRYLMVDVVPSLEPAVRNLEKLNGVAEGAATFHVGYIGAKDSVTGEGDAQVQGAQKMVKAYSKLWGTGLTEEDGAAIHHTVSLRSLFAQHALPECVDMLDIDVQGSEYANFQGHAGIFAKDGDSIALLNARVRRVHIGTHVGEGFEVELQHLSALFRANHWEAVWNFAPGGGKRGRPTPWGPVDFGDGVLSYVNQNPGSACPATQPLSLRPVPA